MILTNLVGTMSNTNVDGGVMSNTERTDAGDCALPASSSVPMVYTIGAELESVRKFQGIKKARRRIVKDSLKKLSKDSYNDYNDKVAKLNARIAELNKTLETLVRAKEERQRLNREKHICDLEYKVRALEEQICSLKHLNIN